MKILPILNWVLGTNRPLASPWLAIIPNSHNLKLRTDSGTVLPVIKINMHHNANWNCSKVIRSRSRKVLMVELFDSATSHC